VVGLAVAIVLFEGGLNLNLRRLQREAHTIRRLITTGALITAVGGATAARYFMGWDWTIAILFGTLVAVTGPTVINPLTRRIRLKKNLRTILEAEGVLIDPIGAIAAVVALEVILELHHVGAAQAAQGLLALPVRLGLGLALGLVGGVVIGLLLRRKKVVPEGFENIFTLSLVLALFEISNGLLEESGIMTVAVAGIVVGNMKTRVQRDLLEFKEQLTVLLVGLLFVLLSADVRLSDVTALGWAGVATVAALILVVRPLNVAVSTAGSELKWNERAFLGWLAPRGIVAFAVASLFAQRLTVENLADGRQFMALVFLVIAMTVMVQGGTAGLVARLLGVQRPGNAGWVIVGANPLGRALGKALRDATADANGGGGAAEEVVLVDSSAAEATAAEQDGFRIIYGNASEERILLRADVDARRALVAVTPNGAVNLRVAEKAMELFRVPRAFVAVQIGLAGARENHVTEAEAGILFGRAIDFERWTHHLLHGDHAVERWRYMGDDRIPVAPAAPAADGIRRVPLLPLVHVRGAKAMPVDGSTNARQGDEAVFLWLAADHDHAREWLLEASWQPVPEIPGSDAAVTE
jgi:NhaP-type Na+/H+ or K+/H+ antiporter